MNLFGSTEDMKKYIYNFLWSYSSWNKEKKKSEKKNGRRGRRMDGLLPIFQFESRYNGLYRDTGHRGV